jgi:hypothetical protein
MIVPVLFASSGFLWPNAGKVRTDINVCWVNPNSAPGASPADRAAWRDGRRRAVEEWSRYARIDLEVGVISSLTTATRHALRLSRAD